MDIFQTTATTLVLAKEIIDFIERYHTAYRDAQEILTRIKEIEAVLKDVKLAVKKRAPPVNGQEVEVIAQIGDSVKSCHVLLSKVKHVLEKNLKSKRFERTRLVFGRKSLVEMQTDLANHINILHLMLSVLTTLDAADIRAGIAQILEVLKSQGWGGEKSFTTSSPQALPTGGDNSRPDNKLTERSALAKLVEDSQNDDTHEVLAQVIRKARTVHDSHPSEEWQSDDFDSEDEGSPPQHTPFSTNTPPGEVLEPTVTEDSGEPRRNSESLKQFSDDMLTTLIFEYRTAAEDEAQQSNFNRAATKLRQAITYAEELERRSNSSERNSRVLYEQLSSIFQKHGQWGESLSILSALLASDAESRPVEKAWHEQLFAAAHLGKDVDGCTGGKHSNPTLLETATLHAMKAFNFRNDSRDESREELERQRACITLNANIYERRNLKVEAKMFWERLKDLDDLLPGRQSVDHSGAERRPITHEARQKQIVQAIDDRNHAEMRRLRPYDSADIEELDMDRTTTLFFSAIKCSDATSVECFLAQPTADGLANSTDPGEERKNIRPLHMAARQCEDDSLHVFQSLLRHDAEIDAQDGDGRTALIQAVKSNNLGAVKLLLNHSANKEIVDRDEWCILHHAVRLDDTRVLKFLLKLAQGLIHQTDEVEDTPLHHAVKLERADMVKVLCEGSQDLDIDVSNTAGHYPLYLAAAHPLTDRRHKVFEELVRQGAVSKDANPPPYMRDYQKLSTARRLSDVSIATTLTGGSDRG